MQPLRSKLFLETRDSRPETPAKAGLCVKAFQVFPPFNGLRLTYLYAYMYANKYTYMKQEVILMPKTLAMVEARKRLTSLPEEFEREKDMDVVAVTRRGKPVLALMPWELYETITETLEILGDAKLASELRESVAEYGRGEGIAWEKAKEDLDL